MTEVWDTVWHEATPQLNERTRTMEQLRPRRRLFASGRISPTGAVAPLTHLSARIDDAGLRISSAMIPQSDAGGFVVEMEAAAMRHEMQRAIREAA